MPGKILRFEELTSPEIEQLDKDKSVVFLSLSPIEGHGSHLPLGVDFYDACYFAERTAELTIQKRPEFDALIYPGIPLGTQLYKQPGSVRIKSGTLYDVITGVGHSLANWGFRYIFLLSGHGSPKDIVALEAACLKVSKKRNIEMHNLSGALAVRFLKGEFVDRISGKLPNPLTTDEIERLKNDIHGGWWETSMMLWLKPELVKDQYKSLPENRKSKDSSGTKPGYFGSPSKATAEFAEISMLVLVEEVASIIGMCLDGKDVKEYTISPIYKIPILRPKFRRHLFSAILITVKVLVLAWIIYKLLLR